MTQSEPSETIELEEVAAYTLVVSIFELAQGSPNIEEEIGRYLHLIKPHWRVAEQVRTRVKERIDLLIGDMIKMGMHAKSTEVYVSGVKNNSEISPKDIDDASAMTTRVLQECLKSPEKPNRWKLIEQIVQHVLRKDKHYYGKGGRPRQGERVRPDIAGCDPMLSKFCHYGLRAQETGTPEFNEMFSDMVTYVKRELAEGTLTDFMAETLRDIIAIYNKHHPGTMVEIPGLDKYRQRVP